MTHKEIVESVRFNGNAYNLISYASKLSYYKIKRKDIAPKRFTNDRERAANNRKSATQIKRELDK